MRAALAVALAALLCPCPTSAGTLQVSVVDDAGSDRSATITIIATPRSVSADQRRLQARIGQPASFADLEEGLWEIGVDVDERWWEPTLVYVAEDDQKEVRLKLYPTADLRGRLSLDPAGTGQPQELEVFFSLNDGRGRVGVPSQGGDRCRIEDDRFLCRVPAGLRNVRLRIPGRQSHFLWGLNLPPGSARDLGIRTFETGSAVFGFVPACEGKAPDPTCKVKLEPYQGPAPSRADARRRSALTLEESVDEQGFFYVGGLTPGTYELSAHKQGFAPSTLLPLHVHPGTESEIVDPIELQPPVDLVVEVMPAQDPWGREWAVEVFELGLAPGTARLVGRGSLEDGRWHRPGLAQGTYRLRISDRSGSRWLTKELEIAPRTGVLHLAMPVVSVRGKVTLGNSPLAAELWFGGRYGERRLHTESDADGFFQTYLPESGMWRIGVHARDPGVTRTLKGVRVPEPEDGRPVTVDLRLPDTRLFGKAIDDEGRPVSDATVTVIDFKTRERPAMTRTDEIGDFSFHGLEPGAVQVSAQRGELRSNEVVAHLQDEPSPTRLFLTLRRAQEIRAVVRGPRGPVVGAVALTTPVGASVGDKVATDVQGRFSTRVPADTTALDVVVLPPGYVFTAQRLPITQGTVDVQLAEHGGTLMIPGGLTALFDVARGGDSLLLFNGPVTIQPQLLEEWERIQKALGHDTGEFELTILPDVAPGVYRTCLISPAEVSSFALRQSDPGRCISSQVVPGGTTLLDPADLRED